VFRIKFNEQGEVIRNKVRLVAQVYSQQEGIDYTETFTPIVNHGTLYIKWMLRVHF